MKKLLLLLRLLPCLALAEDADTALWDYILTDEGAVITEYYRTEVSPDVLVIPAALDGHPVVDIAEGAFTVLMSEISFEGDIPHLTNEDGFLIDTRTDTLLYTAPSSRGKELPAVRRLGKYSLINWAEWDMDVVIPEGVEEIGDAAFYDVSLASLTLPETLRVIETDAFYSFGVEGDEVILPAGVKTVQFGAFGMGYVDADPTGRTYWHLTVTPTDKWRTRFETYFEYVERTGDDSLLEEYTLDLFEYALTDEGAVITNWNYNGYGDGVPRVITLPSELGGQPVIGIANNALNTYEMYYEHSFALVIPEGVKWLSDDAFWCCHNADAIYFPASLTNIPEGCFDHVHAEFIVAEGNPRYEMCDGFLIDKQRDAIVYTTPQCADKPIPAVRRIGSSSMENWGTEWEQDVVIPEGVEEIGSFAFYDWILGHITLPESLRVIETEAFCVVITEPVVIPASVELVQRGAFFYDETSVIVTSDSTHFETSEEYEARVGYLWWGDDE